MMISGKMFSQSQQIAKQTAWEHEEKGEVHISHQNSFTKFKLCHSP